MKKSILDFTSAEAHKFFINQNRYVTVPLPEYFNFNELLQKINSEIQDKNLKSLCHNPKELPSSFEDVNYRFYSNKDGAYDWRPIDIVNPVLYVYLVNLITKDENWELIKNLLSKNTAIEVQSIPLVDEEDEDIKIKSLVENWIKNVERKSVSLGMEYNYLTIVDISNCYSSFYTHSIAWALHTKDIAKNSRFDITLLGNEIDRIIRCMSNGQTNGIPQGSVIMDLIAEILLKYLDVEIIKKIPDDILFKIVRYRDDYRIFTKNKSDSLLIVKALSETLAENGLKLNSQKISFNEDVVKESVKIDKWRKLYINLENASDLESKFLLLYDFSIKHKNSGSLKYYFSHILSDLYDNELVFVYEDAKFYISILTNITLKSPDMYPIYIFIISHIMDSLSVKEREKLFVLIKEKFSLIPNTAILDIWFQRLCKDSFVQINGSSTTRLTSIVNGEDTNLLWNIEWTNSHLKAIVENTPIIDNDIFEEEEFLLRMDEFENLSHTFWSYINR
jgi:hypothetical protein